MMFRELNEEEKERFRKWARDNYITFTDIKSIWHPIVRAECTEMNYEDSMQILAIAMPI